MQLSEWLDGLSALRNEPARIVATAETKELIEQLTTIGLKVRARVDSVVLPSSMLTRFVTDSHRAAPAARPPGRGRRDPRSAHRTSAADKPELLLPVGGPP